MPEKNRKFTSNKNRKKQLNLARSTKQSKCKSAPSAPSAGGQAPPAGVQVPSANGRADGPADGRADGPADGQPDGPADGPAASTDEIAPLANGSIDDKEAAAEALPPGKFRMVAVDQIEVEARRDPVPLPHSGPPKRKRGRPRKESSNGMA